MKKIIYLTAIIFAFASFKGNELMSQKSNINQKLKNKTMEIIYEQQHGNLHITFHRNNTADKIEWKTLVTNKKGDTILLHTDSSEKNIAWKHQETIGESPTSLYNISGSYLDENSLYIIYNRFGELFISKYTFTEKIVL